MGLLIYLMMNKLKRKGKNMGTLGIGALNKTHLTASVHGRSTISKDILGEPNSVSKIIRFSV